MTLQGINIKEVKCKRALNPCKIKGFDYTLNPYIGCTLGCVYCYARFMSFYRGNITEKWGGFVDVKVNIAKVLEEQVKHIKLGNVMISSVTDAYQPLEAKYKLTRSCLDILAKNKFKISLLTKSPLITRDIDILKKFNRKDYQIQPGFTIICLDEKDSRNFESNSSSVESRLKALKELHKAGISTFVFIAPFIPKISDKNLEKLFERFKEVGVDSVLIDKLNLKSGNWKYIKKVFYEHYPELIYKYRKKYLTKEYYKDIKNKVVDLAKKYNLKLTLIFEDKNIIKKKDIIKKKTYNKITDY